MKTALLAALAGATLLLAGCGSPSSSTAGTTGSSAPGSGAGGGSGSGSAGGKMTVAVIPMGTTHEYWKALHEGAEEAGKELGVEIKWKGPLKEDDRAGQIGIVQGFTADNVSGIVLAPLDANALMRPVESAMEKKIPVIVVDSPLTGEPGKDYTALIATNNKLGGKLGGERLVQLLGGKGKVVMLRNAVGSASTAAREEGFLEAMKAAPGITVLSDNARGGRTQGEAQTKAMQMVDTLKQADGIFCSNESTSAGMLQALVQNGIAGKVKFVGFDSSPVLVSALRDGKIDALVVQNPRKMGYEGVKAVVTKLKGGTIPANTDTGVTIVDKANLDTADVKKLIGN